MNNLASLRLHTQHIGGSTQSIPEMVAYMGAMQAQDYYGSLWAIGLRTKKTEREVIAAIEAHQIIRTWPQRGTIHYVTPEDAAWMTRLSAPRLLRGITTRHARLGITEAITQRSQEVFQLALANGKQLTRTGLLQLLEDDGISTTNGRGYHLLWLASQCGITYIGAMEGKQQTFGLLSHLVPHPQALEESDAITELATRYFSSHGPATVHDFGWWSGLPLTAIRSAVASAGTTLMSEVMNGTTYWSAPRTEKDDVPEALLLPGFDEYILGYKDRSAQMKPEYLAKIIPGSNGMFMPSLILRGQVVGMWKRVLKKDRVIISASLFEPVSNADKKLFDTAANVYGAFMEVPAELHFSE